MKNALNVVVLVSLLVFASGCAGVAEKVAYDFGFGEKPEGYVPLSERVMYNLPGIADAELKRMNREERAGEVKFQKGEGLKGKYYKIVKVYEKGIPLEAKAISKGVNDDRGYLGYIEYTYRMYEGARKNTRTEAAAEPATIRTNDTGRAMYRYAFSAGGNWNGAKGERAKR